MGSVIVDLLVCSFICAFVLKCEAQDLNTRELLRAQIVKKYPTDDKDQFSDYVIQLSKPTANLIIYHRGDPNQPVFSHKPLGRAGIKVIIFYKGNDTDYLLPEDKNTYLVLRKETTGLKYYVHTAIVYKISSRNADKLVVFNDARIEQRINSSSVLNVMGSRYSERFGSNDPRPRCRWIASVLYCNANTTVASPKRKFLPPLETFIPKERQTYGDSADQSSGGDKSSASGGKKSLTENEDESNGEEKPGDPESENKLSDEGEAKPESEGGENAVAEGNEATEKSSTDGEENAEDANKQGSEERYLRVKEGSGGETEKGRSAKKKKGRHPRNVRLPLELF